MKAMEQQHRIATIHYWTHALGFASIVFTVALLYVSAYGVTDPMAALVQGLGGTAGVLIGSSFALSSFCYYFDFLDTKIIYRKYLGLLGFYFATATCIFLFLSRPDIYIYNFRTFMQTPSFLFGFPAMVILAFMALISNNYAMRLLGPQNWRRALRLGYIAYILLIVKAYFLEKYVWGAWWETVDGLPPPELVLTVFAICVLLFRASVFIIKAMKKPAIVSRPTT